jgi:glycosyltransferase involved in cell wall biosynthesis
VLFFFWGRRGALSRFTLDLAHAAVDLPDLEPTFSIARSNELYDEFAKFGSRLLPVDTFDSVSGSLRFDNAIELRRRILGEIKARKIDAVVSLMPHVWSPLVTGNFKSIGCRYAVIVHDASPHPGDPTASINRWLMRDVRNADIIITLSQAVAGRLSARRMVDWRKLYTLFHPDFDYGEPLKPSFPAPGEPFRLLTLGRLLEYKALPMLADAMELLRGNGVNVELGVYGEGNIRGIRGRLDALGVTIVNTWIKNDDIRGICSRNHAVVLSHSEASQSGVIATAHGLGLPVITTPVGGLSEQVLHMETGLIAEHADPQSLAEAIARLAGNQRLYAHIVKGIERTREDRSMKRFVQELVSHACFATSV